MVAVQAWPKAFHQKDGDKAHGDEGDRRPDEKSDVHKAHDWSLQPGGKPLGGGFNCYDSRKSTKYTGLSVT